LGTSFDELITLWGQVVKVMWFVTVFTKYAIFNLFYNLLLCVTFDMVYGGLQTVNDGSQTV